MKTDSRSDTFYRLHSKIIWYNNISGLVVPAFPYRGELYRAVLEVSSFVVNVLAVVSSVAFVGGVFFVPDLDFITYSSTGTCTITVVYVTIVGFLTAGKRQEFAELSSRTGEIFDMCSDDPLDDRKTFTKTFQRNIKLLNAYATWVLGLTTLVAVLYVLPGYIQNFESLGFSGDSALEFPLWMPFEYKNSPYLDVAFSIELFGIVMCGIRKTCTECLLLAYLHSQILCLRHVQYTLQTVFHDDTSKNNRTVAIKLQETFETSGDEHKSRNNPHGFSKLSSREDKLRHWITMHQKVLE